MSTQLEQFAAEINRHFFLREYSFDKNTFKAACRSQLELADHVIRSPQALFIFQVKERSQNAPSDESSVGKWFRQKVIKVGCGQIADSMRFLCEEPEIQVQNQRGHIFDLARSGELTIPIILYSSGATLPVKIAQSRHHVSKRAGFVHVMNVEDYYHLCRTLVLPRELAAYFLFRQDLFLRNPHFVRSEAVITAQFIAKAEESPSDPEARRILLDTSEDNSTFDLTPILGRFGDKVKYFEGSGSGLDYYRVLEEFARLGRAEMRVLKRYLSWAQANAEGEQSARPVRMISVSRRAGFVVFPVHKGAFDKRLDALQNFAMLTKYEFRLERQIGVCIGRDGHEIEIDWLFLEYPWQRDWELEEALEKNYPFQPTREPRLEYGYPS